MRLYQKKIPVIAQEIVKRLTAEDDIETRNGPEVQLDIESVMNEYIRLEREITDKAREHLKNTGLSFEHFGRVKRAKAEERDFAMGEEGIRYMSSQMLEILMQSTHVDEIYTDDREIRAKLEAVLQKYMTLDEEIEEEVRKRLKNLEEGSSAWDIEYKKMLLKMKSKYQLE